MCLHVLIFYVPYFSCAYVLTCLYIFFMPTYLNFMKHENPPFFIHYCVGHGDDIEYHVKSGGGGCRVRWKASLSRYLHLKLASEKSIFDTTISTQKLYVSRRSCQGTCTMHVSTSLCIDMQPRFCKEYFNVKLTTFSTAKETAFDTR